MIKLPMSVKSMHLRDAGYSIKEQAEIYDMQLQDLYNNPREYLDSLEFLRPYVLSWSNNKRTKSAVLPYKYTAKGKAL